MEAIFFEGDRYLSSVFVELINTEILIKHSDTIVMNHEEPSSVELTL